MTTHDLIKTIATKHNVNINKAHKLIIILAREGGISIARTARLILMSIKVKAYFSNRLLSFN